MRQLRIKGLVGEVNAVRQACTSPMTPAQREDLKIRVHHTVSQVDEICRQHRVRPSQLPAPTRRAYEFLLKLDLNSLPPATVASGEQKMQRHLPGSIRLTGLRTFLDGLLDDLARQTHLGRLDAAAMLRVVQQTAYRLDHQMGRDELKPGHLRAESRELAAWFRYFAQSQHMERYVQSVRRAQAIFASLPRAAGRWRLPLLVHFRPSSHLYRWRMTSAGTRIVLSTSMIGLEDEALGALGRMMLGDRRHWPAVHEAMLSEPYQSVRTAMDEAAGKVERTRGMAYDLAMVFDEVNRRYFGGCMARPKLIWTKRLTGRQFGHYEFAHDVVCISSTLDRPDVPPFVVEHVMHHELLHKKHGSKWSGSRRRSHTSEFRSDERTFERFEEADRFLQSLSRRMS
jgi:hypothetical protein